MAVVEVDQSFILLSPRHNNVSDLVILLANRVIATDNARVVYALLIINKAGGLVYNRTFNPSLTQLSGNDYLVLAGTFHGIHAISKQLSPVTLPRNSTGIESLQASRFLMSCFQTPTGIKFLLFTEPSMDPAKVEEKMRKLYELYAEFVMRNPFYSLEMPIRSDKFERAVAQGVAVR